MISAIFERFVETTPCTVMVRAILERIFAPDALNQLFEDTADRQYQRTLLFSTVVGLMSFVVCGMYPTVSAAYQAFEKVIGVSKVAVYAKLNGLEPPISQALVRYSHEQLVAVRAEFPGTERTILPGYEVRILDGNHLAGTEHRLGVLRSHSAGALPGQALVVLDPQRELVVDVFPEEDGHAQERSLLPQVLAHVEAAQVWIGDRNFCTTDCLSTIADKQAYFVIREHQALGWSEVTSLQSVGQTDSGEALFEQRIRLKSGLVVRRIVVKLHQPTRHGDEFVAILTNLPQSEVKAASVATLYRNRWQIENMFQVITDTFHCELRPLGYPRAALFVFCVALVAFNVLSIVRSALKQVHGVEVIDQTLSNYYVVEEVQSTFRGMEIAIPADEWEIFGTMSVTEFAQCLQHWAEGVNLKRFRKHPRAPKKPKTKKPFDPKHPHVSTDRLLKSSTKKSP